MNDDFRVVDLVSKGDVADIWQGIHTASKTQVYVVTVNKKSEEQTFDQARLQQLEPIAPSVNHAHILKYYKIVKSESTIAIIMEHPRVCLLALLVH